MKKIITICMLSSLAFVACQKEKLTQTESESREVTIVATLGNNTKSVVKDGGKQVYWTPSEDIHVFFNNSSSKFTSTNTQKAITAEFTGSLNYIIGSQEGGTSNKTLFALSPYLSTATCDGTTISTTLPANQIACEGTFNNGTYIIAAKSDSFNVPFYGVCGGLRFSLSNTGVKKVIFEGNNGEKLAGDIKISFSDSNLPEVSEVTNVTGLRVA